jgi:hypothetical protein
MDIKVLIETAAHPWEIGWDTFVAIGTILLAVLPGGWPHAPGNWPRRPQPTSGHSGGPFSCPTTTPPKSLTTATRPRPSSSNV